MEIRFNDFLKVEMHAGRIDHVEEFPEARSPAWKLWIDFGQEIGRRQSSARITELYRREDLLGRMIVAVTNLPPKRVAGFPSEVLVLGVPDAEGRVVLLAPERETPPGSRVY